MDILNFISWIASKRRVVTTAPDDALVPIGIRTETRDDKYTTVAIKKSDLITIPEPTYKVYTALLTQLSNNAPTAIVLENTLDNTVTLSRNSAGNYSITGVDFTDVNKVYVNLKNINLMLPQVSNQFFYFSVASGVINIRTTQVNFTTLTFAPNDSMLDKCPIEIRVYN